MDEKRQQMKEMYKRLPKMEYEEYHQVSNLNSSDINLIKQISRKQLDKAMEFLQDNELSQLRYQLNSLQLKNAMLTTRIDELENKTQQQEKQENNDNPRLVETIDVVDLYYSDYPRGIIESLETVYSFSLDEYYEEPACFLTIPLLSTDKSFIYDNTIYHRLDYGTLKNLNKDIVDTELQKQWGEEMQKIHDLCFSPPPYLKICYTIQFTEGRMIQMNNETKNTNITPEYKPHKFKRTGFYKKGEEEGD